VTELAAENARRRTTENSLQAQLKRMRLLDHITRAIGKRQDLASIFQVVIRNVEQSLPAEGCWIGLKGPETDLLAINDELIYEPHVSAEITALPPRLAALKLGALVAAPLRSEGEQLGAILVARREIASFDSDECEFLRQLSEHVALAARQAKLHESLQVAYDDLQPDTACNVAAGTPECPGADGKRDRP
jgi:GAF domain-containing protein